MENNSENFKIEFLHSIENVKDDNIDAIIQLDNGEKYHVTVMTFKNIESMISKNKEKGELNKGMYFISPNTLFVNSLALETIKAAISDVILNQYHLSVFYPTNELAYKAIVNNLKLGIE